jgi:hypothetical protein
MQGARGIFSALRLGAALGAALVVSACDQGNQSKSSGNDTPAAKTAAPSSIPMGGAKSVTRFFIVSKGLGKGGDMGGLSGADAHCQALAEAQGAGDHNWHAYLSTQATATTPAVNARDRIGGGPWYNADGDLIAQNLSQLHSTMNKLAKDTAVTEAADEVAADQHAILTGSRPDGTAFPAGADRTCRSWTSSGTGGAQIGYSDRAGEGAESWNSSRATDGCSEDAFRRSGGAGLFYCFATN